MKDQGHYLRQRSGTAHAWSSEGRDWLIIDLRPAQEYFTYVETSPLPVKGWKI
jgi:hypothetical protein